MIIGTKIEFENLADFILRDYLGNKYDSYIPFDVQAFAEDYLKLEISYTKFEQEQNIEGLRTGNQIILDHRLSEPSKVGERNFTVAHECGHDIINWQDPTYETTDAYGNPDLGINASNEEYLERHPYASREYYSLCNFDMSEVEIVDQMELPGMSMGGM